jgi:DNA primase
LSSISDKAVVERVRTAIDIVDVAQSYFPLTRRGDRYVALCPFHKEKTPSFSLHSGKQVYHCFGCKKSGDVFTLVMELDRLTFPEALKVLARRAGVALPERGPRGVAAEAEEERRLELFAVLKHAEEFYRAALESPQGAIAREYLAQRGFSIDALEQFGVGFAPAEWRALFDHLLRRGHREDAIVRAGVVRRKEDGKRPFDLLRRRVVVPIRDVRGRVVAFGGRVLPGDDGGPKYLNTPETELFSKRALLFGLDRAREEAAHRGEFVVVEGYLDVIGAHQHGVSHVVATLGTALTPDHARLMKRSAERVTLLFDPDEGGRRGTDLGLAVLLEAGFDVGVATLPDGLDPDEYLARHGGDAAAEFDRFLIASREELVEYLMRRAGERTGEGGKEAMEEAARGVLRAIGFVRNPLQRDHIVMQLANRFLISEPLLRAEAGRLIRQESAGATPAADEISLPSVGALPKDEQDEVFVLHGVTTCATLARRAVEELTERDFRDSSRKRLFEAARRLCASGATPSPSLLAASLEEDVTAQSMLSQVVGCEMPAGESPEKAIDRLVARRSSLEYRRLREAANRTGVLKSSDDSVVDPNLAELSRRQAERYRRLKEQERTRFEGT